MKRPALLAALAAAMFAPTEPGQRKRRGRRRRKRTKRHRAGIKLRCRTLERYRAARATLGPPIRSRWDIRREALRKVFAAAGFVDASDPPPTAGAP